jgi:hypothetical protein
VGRDELDHEPDFVDADAAPGSPGARLPNTSRGTNVILLHGYSPDMPETNHMVCAYCLREETETRAVTAVYGTLLCAEHALVALGEGRMRHDDEER